MREALLYERLDGGKVRCSLCAHLCTIKPGRRGKCAVRENRDGTLISLVYGRLVSMNPDPIEKKPLFHYLPGTRSHSIATAGCNLRCEHCQNYEISQYPRMRPDVEMPGRVTSPAEVVEAARGGGCASISYTYTEPTIFMEFALDTARLAREAGMGNVFVSNGFMSPEGVRLIAPVLDAINVDLKGDDDFYKKVCGARLGPVKETIGTMHSLGVWVEVTTLVIPGHNDSDEALREIAGFIASVGTSIPWHVSQFYPTYKMTDRPRTPIETLRRARGIGADEGLKYVYEGNVPGEGGEDTECPSCGETLIKRSGYTIGEDRMKAGACPSCGLRIAGIWGS